MQRLAVMIVVLWTGTTGPAIASPPSEPDEVDGRPMIEWSSWVRVGYGIAHPTTAPASVARTVLPDPPREQATAWDLAIGAEATLPLNDSGDLRVGPWVEARALTIVGGAELQLGGIPRSLDMFWYRGQGQLTVRVGGNATHGTAAVAYGYRAPWELFGSSRGDTRYMIGVRLVATATRAHDDPRDWTAALGIEFEPVGAVRYVFGVRSWY
ncbi:MAG: hypothetical protein H0T89_02860 [Deltaproteobacteria bacterium]|nr:hypothetical protein [Deltaproteobacteria bacterium]MDQ3299343.1 hypothetical protein [Myxococcota bacterium]